MNRPLLENLESRRLLATGDFGAPTFLVVTNNSQNFGAQPRATSYIDVSDVGQSGFGGVNEIETFSIGVFEESQTRNAEEPAATAINPANGDTYVLASDSGTPGTGSADTNGDWDLYRYNFAVAYDDFVTNSRPKGVTYLPAVSPDGFDYLAAYGNLPLGPTGLPTVAPIVDDIPLAGIPNGVDNTNADPSDDVVFLPGLVDKIGEVARPQPAGGGFFDNDPITLEFVSPDRLLLLEETGVDGVGDESFGVRLIERVSTQPGLATNPGDVDPTADPQLLGGYNPQTTESWVSYDLAGDINLDGTSSVDPEGFRYVEQDGVQGFWISDDDAFDPDGDGPLPTNFFAQLGFYTLDLDARTFAEGEFRINTPEGPVTTNRFTLDENPVLDTGTNDGDLDFFDVDEDGSLVISESDFFDGSNSDIIFRDVVTYDAADGEDVTPGTGPEGLFGGFLYFEEPNYTLTNGGEGANEVDGRFGVFERGENRVYRFDIDSNTGPNEITADLYVYDLDDGGSLVYEELDAFDAFFGSANTIHAFTLGDAFLQDGLVGVGDVNALYEAARNGGAVENEANDLTGDDVVTLGEADDTDLAFLIEKVIGTAFGDSNLDGTVNLADFGNLRAGFGSGSLFGQGDFDGSGTTNLADFGILRSNFGFNADDDSVFA